MEIFAKSSARAVRLLLFAAGLMLYACGGQPTPIAVPPTVSPPTAVPVEPTATFIPPTAPPAGPVFAVDDDAVNRDTTQAGLSPALAVGSTTAGAPGNAGGPWAGNAEGGLRQIFVSELVSGAFQPHGAALNIHLNVVAADPSITFAGEDRLVPWAAWAEPSPSFGGAAQIFASRFNAASGLWQPAGQDP